MKVVDAVSTMEGQGMHVHRALPNMAVGRVDPFLLLDHMGPTEFGPGEGKGAPDHPHRGFETVTYVLDGRLEHRDSRGNVGDLGPGDIQWMTAGRGVIHSELPHPDLQATGGVVHGLQLWINLPKADKMMEPRYQDIVASDIPEVQVPGGRVRVIAGRFEDVEAVIDTRTPITYLHAILEPGATVSLPVPEGHEGFAYAIDGVGEAGLPIHGRQTLLLRGHTGNLPVMAGPEGLSLILVTGVPIMEPVFQYGPFVMNERSEIMDAIKDYQSGRLA